MKKNIGAWIAKTKIPLILSAVCVIALICIFIFVKPGTGKNVSVSTEETDLSYSASESLNNIETSAGGTSGDDKTGQSEKENSTGESSESGDVSGTTVITSIITQYDSPNIENKESEVQENTKNQNNGSGQNTTSETVTEKKEDDSKSITVPEEKDFCIFSISCHSVFSYGDKVSDSVLNKIPADGWIYKAQSVEIEEGESVFDILRRVCEENNIDIDYSYNPIFNTVYIKGIDNLYEFDCGNQSGWLYMVNSVIPNYGCSNYYVSSGDTVEFKFSCKGYGADLS